jgi:hypothetical protein
MSDKNSTDIEIQIRESLSSTSSLNQTNVLTEDWDAPHNKENPRNWSACE